MSLVGDPGRRSSAGPTADLKVRPPLVFIALLLSALATTASAAAQTPTLPNLTAPVNDTAKLVDASSSSEIDRIIRSLQSTTGDVIVVATVQSIAPFGTVEEYAVKLFEQAGIGSKANDNGLLIVVAAEERKVRIEVGYGLEEFVTDGFAGEVIRTHMLPAFRQGQYGAGLVAGTSALATRIADRRGTALTDVQTPPARRDRGDDGPGAGLIFVGILIFLLVQWLSRHSRGGPRFRGRRRGGTWSGWHGGIGGFGGGFGSGGFSGGGFGGGGFGGFGGGRSGGGGASGGW